MSLKRELAPVKANLLDNFWRIIDKEPIKTISFTDFLVDVLIKRYEKVSRIEVGLLDKYRKRFNKEYAGLLDYVEIHAKEGDIIKLEKYVKKKVNGSFSRIIEDFVNDYKSKA